MNNIFENKKFTLFVIFVGFFISVLLSINNLNKYDKNLINEDGNSYHQMIKGDTYRYLSHGNEIKDQLENNLNFFETGREHYTKYLPPRVYALYYHFFNIDLFEDPNHKEIKIGIHLPYLVLQSLLYYFSIILLYLSISKIINQKISFLIILFLSLEPTILQYHSSFWSESLFFSIQILLISLILKKKQTNLNFFFIGVLLTILSFQKEYSIFYILPVMIYFKFSLNNFNYKKFIFLIIGFFLIQSILGYNNYKRSGQFYIMTADSKVNLHIDLVGKVIGKKFNLTGREFDSMEGVATLEWVKKNKIKYDEILTKNIKEPGYMDYRSALSEKNKIKFDEFIRSRTLNYISKYPLDFIKHVTKSSLHIVLLNPFHVYSDNNFVSGEIYYTSEMHGRLILYRVLYSLIIYIVCVYGLHQIIKERKYNILFYLILSIAYFYGLVSWHGNTRYFMPVMIYLAFLFGYGLNGFLSLKQSN